MHVILNGFSTALTFVPKSIFSRLITNKKFELMLTRRAKAYSSFGLVV